MKPELMRNAKRELHFLIVNTILKYNPTDEDLDELWEYVENLAKIEKDLK
jgi:hypothetical protein